MSHHGIDPEQQKAMSEAMQEIFGEFPNGKLNVNDEGAIAMVVGEENGSVVLRFPKPVAWIGFTPDEALGLAETLITHARRVVATVPLVLRIGREDKLTG